MVLQTLGSPDFFRNDFPSFSCIRFIFPPQSPPTPPPPPSSAQVCKCTALNLYVTRRAKPNNIQVKRQVRHGNVTPERCSLHPFPGVYSELIYNFPELTHCLCGISLRETRGRELQSRTLESRPKIILQPVYLKELPRYQGLFYMTAFYILLFPDRFWLRWGVSMGLHE